MSYDIDTWKTKCLDNLTIPLKAFFKHERSDWHPEHPKLTNPETGEVVMECGCGQEIKGKVEGENLIVAEFDMAGEGSGTFYNWILMPALEESTGTLEAVLIWEGGDSINRLQVKNGVVKAENVDL